MAQWLKIPNVSSFYKIYMVNLHTHKINVIKSRFLKASKKKKKSGGEQLRKTPNVSLWPPFVPPHTESNVYIEPVKWFSRLRYLLLSLIT